MNTLNRVTCDTPSTTSTITSQQMSPLKEDRLIETAIQQLNPSTISNVTTTIEKEMEIKPVIGTIYNSPTLANSISKVAIGKIVFEPEYDINAYNSGFKMGKRNHQSKGILSKKIKKDLPYRYWYKQGYDTAQMTISEETRKRNEDTFKKRDANRKEITNKEKANNKTPRKVILLTKEINKLTTSNNFTNTIDMNDRATVLKEAQIAFTAGYEYALAGLPLKDYKFPQYSTLLYQQQFHRGYQKFVTEKEPIQTNSNGLPEQINGDLQPMVVETKTNSEVDNTSSEVNNTKKRDRDCLKNEPISQKARKLDNNSDAGRSANRNRTSKKSNQDLTEKKLAAEKLKFEILEQAKVAYSDGYVNGLNDFPIEYFKFPRSWTKFYQEEFTKGYQKAKVDKLQMDSTPT